MEDVVIKYEDTGDTGMCDTRELKPEASELPPDAVLSRLKADENSDIQPDLVAEFELVEVKREHHLDLLEPETDDQHSGLSVSNRTDDLAVSNRPVKAVSSLLTGNDFIRPKFGVEFLKNGHHKPVCGISQKVYRCSECGETFVWQYHLRRHRKIHLREETYRCEFCLIDYARDVSLSNRMFECRECHQEFGSKQSVIRHAKEKHPERIRMIARRGRTFICVMGAYHGFTPCDRNFVMCNTCGELFNTKLQLMEHHRTNSHCDGIHKSNGHCDGIHSVDTHSVDEEDSSSHDDSFDSHQSADPPTVVTGLKSWPIVIAPDFTEHRTLTEQIGR